MCLKTAYLISQWCCDVADRLTRCPCPRPRQCSIHPCTMCTFAQHYVFSSSSDSSKYPLQSAGFSPSPCEHNSSHVSLLPGTKNTAGAMPGLGVRGVGLLNDDIDIAINTQLFAMFNQVVSTLRWDPCLTGTLLTGSFEDLCKLYCIYHSIDVNIV